MGPQPSFDSSKGSFGSGFAFIISLIGLAALIGFLLPVAIAQATPIGLLVTTNVVGTSTPASSFEDHVMSSTSVEISGSPQPGSSTGVGFVAFPDNYVVSQAAGSGVDLSDFTVTYGGDCDANGNVTVGNTQANCVITDTYNAPAPTTYTVTIDKYLDGQPATADSADSTAFPMVSTWTAANLNGGVQSSGSYTLSPTGFNSPNPYEAITSPMDSGASYSTNEDTTGDQSTVGATCDSGDPYALVGYTTGDTLADAASATPSTTVPSFTNLSQNEYVIVWNESCQVTPPPPTSCTIVSDTNTLDTTDGHAAVLVNPLNAAWTATSTATYDPSAAWIWSENPAMNTTENVTKVFTRTFDIVGTPAGGSIDIAADNGFVLKVNGTTVVDDSTVENNYSTSQHFDISSDLVTGENTVEVDVTNFGVAGSDWTTNPAGVIFQVNLPNNSCTSSTGNTGTLEIDKVIDGAPEGITPDQFSFQVTGSTDGTGSATSFNSDGTNDMTVDTDQTYSVAEVASSTYTTSYSNSQNEDSSDCNDLTVSAGQTTTCTITNMYNNNGGGGGNPTNVSQTIVVKPSNLQGWAFINDNTNGAGTGTMVFGPAIPPLGVGSAQLTTANSSDGQVLESQIDMGTKLSDITKLQYSTYQDATNPSDATAIALQFNVAQDATDPSAGWQGRIVYEPYYNNGGTVPLGSWNTWDALDNGNSLWWFSDPADFGGNCPQSSPCTLSDIIAMYPNIGINDNPALGAVVLKAGSGWSSFDGNVDDLVIGTTDGTNATTTTYDFEPDVSDIGVTKSVDNSTPNIGDTVTYTITASDTGDDATGVVVQDLLPSGLTFVSTTTPDTAGVYDPNTGDWTIGDLSSTTPVTLHIEATVNDGQDDGTVITNTADVTSGDTSTDSENDSASANVTVTIPGNNPTPFTPDVVPGGGGGGGNGPIFGSFSTVAPAGEVLGASTTTVPIPGSCTQYLTAFIKFGGDNDASQVTRLQQFLNQFEGDSLTVNGVYDAATLAALEAFQEKYASDILAPWGETAPTGFVYLTTRREVNIIYCDYTEQFPLTAAQQAEINAYKNEVGNGSDGGVSHTGNTTDKGTGDTTSDNTNDNVSLTQTGQSSSTTFPGLNEVGAAATPGSNPFSSIGNFFYNLFHH